jgi:dipeptidyl aminopeptidase/acylaminoacyl peptidase
MTPEDVGRLVTVGSVAVSPDGAMVAYVVTRIDLTATRYRSAVWLAPTDGSGEPWQLTAGEHDDDAPTWSPDGRRLAFTSSRAADKERKRTLRVLPVMTGGETVTLVERDEGIDGLSWSPDGRNLAFTSRVRSERYAEDEESARPPRKVDRLLARLDTTGWTIDRPTHVFVVPADGSATPRQVTDGPHEHGAPAWSPDGTRLVTCAARHPDADLDIFNDVFLVDLRDAEPTLHALTTTDADYAEPSWSPDGSGVAVLRSAERIGYRHTQVATLDVGATAGKATPVQTTPGHPLTVLTAELDRNCAPYPGARSPVWHGGDLLFGVEDAGAVHLYRAHGDRRLDRIVGGRRSVTSYDARQGTVAFTATDSTTPTELYVLVDGAERRLTHHQDAFLAACPPLESEHLTVLSEDGHPVDAWLVRPAGFDPARRYPLLVSVHGGPHTQYGYCWHDEFQLYAAAGFAVLYANPHGSTGSGEAFARSIISPRSQEDPGTGWGGIDYRDLMAVTDAALERYAFLDGRRTGLLGGSYGGYMASWVIGHTDRFAAVVSERAVNNLLSLEWSSDVAGYFRFETGVSHLDDPDEYLRMSPITYVRDIRTPVLILHSEDDLRCHIEQADCLWVALRLLGREVEYYRFAGESHELSRSGSPRHRVQRAELILEWFQRHLDEARLGPGGGA